MEIRQAVHDSLFTAYHDEKSWAIAHRILAPYVTQSAAQAIFNRMRDSVSDLVEKWTSSPGKRVDVTNDLQRLDVQTVRYCLFSQRNHYLDGAEPPMIPAMASSTMEAMKRPTRPKLLNWLLHGRRYNRDIRTMRGFATEIVDTRKSAETEEHDMLNAMLHAKDPESGKALDDSQVLDEIINMFIGSATAPCLVSAAIYYLLKNPEEITKAREEIDGAVGSNGQIPAADFSNFPYCEAILREAFRLSAPAPGFNIEPVPSSSAPEYITLAEGKYQIPKNQPMIAVLSGVNRDPDVFDDPEAFRPERMQGEAYDQLPAGVKKGFGNGKRECFGKRYAWQWSMITLISIIRRVDLEMADKEYELKQNGAFCVQPLEFFAVAKPRGGGNDTH